MVHYRTQLWGDFHYVGLSVLRELTVGHIASGGSHVTDNVFPDVLLLIQKSIKINKILFLKIIIYISIFYI